MLRKYIIFKNGVISDDAIFDSMGFDPLFILLLAYDKIFVKSMSVSTATHVD